MNVALFTSTFLPTVGGAEMVVHHLALALQAAGVDVTVYTWWGLWRSVRRQLPYPVRPFLPRTCTVSMTTDPAVIPGKRALAGMQLRFWQAVGRHDLWHLHFAYPTAVLAGDALEAMGRPWIVTCHGSDIQKHAATRYGVRLIPHLDAEIARVLPRAHCVTAISESNVADIRSAGVSDERIARVPNGVATAGYGVPRGDRGELRGRFGLPRDRKIILTVGRNEARKGYHLLPEIVRALLQRRQDFLWVVAGRGTDQLPAAWRAPELAPHLRALGQVGEVGPAAGWRERMGALEAVIPLFQCADVFAFPSLVEAFGIVLVEAMAAGLPIVTTDAQGCRDVVQDGRTGVLVPCGDAEAMAAAVDRLLDDPGQMARLGAQGRAAARQYDWAGVAAQYIDVYRQVLAAQAGRRC